MTEHRSDLDRIFHALGRSKRRVILQTLVDREDSQVTCGWIDEFVDSESDEILLHHYHLPLLEDYRFIKVDSAAGRIMKGEAFERVKPVLDSLEPHIEGPSDSPESGDDHE